MDLKVTVQRLSEAERVQLVEHLLEILGPETDGVDRDAFGAELSQRSQEIDEGTAGLVDWSDLKKEAW